MHLFKVAAAAVLVSALACSSSSAAVTFGREKLKASTKTQGDFNLANCRPDQALGKDKVCHAKTVKPTCPTGYVLTGAVCTWTG